MVYSALLAALIAAPVGATVHPASCLKNSSGKAPASLDALQDCQEKAQAAAVAAAAKKGQPLTDDQLEELAEFQRAEARTYLAQAPAFADDPPEAQKDAPGSKNKLGGVTSAELSGVDNKSAAAIVGLQGRMQAAAGDGKAGVTSSMADDARATLIQVQGGVSPDMANLLDSVQRDGGNLTPETMKKLQDAGKEAKGAGLDLNIDPKIENPLLKDDFDADKPAFNAQRPPGSM